MTDDLLASRYQLIRVLGEGAMGVVWLAQDTVLGRPIAIKELRPAPGVDAAEAMDRFLVEARAAARLSHPNIVGVYDVFADGERALIAMELVEGPTLEDVLRRSGAQSSEVVRAIMAQVAQALAVAHQADVIHRDLKPDNIFWTPDGRAVVTDFGLARIGAGRGTVEGTIMGTPGYMAPEQVRGTPTGPQSDVFAWGAVAYTLATAAGPFGEPSLTDPTALAYRIVHEEAPPLVIPDDPALAALIMRCLAKEAARRPLDGSALVAELQTPTQDPRPQVRAIATPPMSSGHAGSRVRSIPVRAIAAGAALVFLAVVATLATRSGPQASAPSTTAVTMPTVPVATTLPPPFPPGTLPAPAGKYVTSVLRPSFALTVDGAWRSLSGENIDLWELVRDTNPDTNILTFGFVDNVFPPEAAPLVREVADTLVQKAPDDIPGWLQQHPRLAVSSVVRIDTHLGPSIQIDFTVRDGYDYNRCLLGSDPNQARPCVLLFRFPQFLNLFVLSGNHFRTYVWTYSSRTLIAIIEAPDDDFAAFAASADKLISTLAPV